MAIRLRRTAKPLADEQTQELKALVARPPQAGQVLGMRTAELNRRHKALPVVRRRIERVLAVLEAEVADLDQDLQDRLKASPLWGEEEDLLQSFLEWARPSPLPYWQVSPNWGA